MTSESVESFGDRLQSPSEVIANINRRISNAVETAEKVRIIPYTLIFEFNIG
uniref:DUF503 domain-containing protein n=1 Tax=Ascaris lumbricoides TaxID=6252 RepID=A0A0M3IMJ6_ASCLU